MHRAHRLVAAAAQVWALCDGTRSPEALATALAEHGVAGAPAVVEQALRQFAREGLLEGTKPRHLSVLHADRRTVIRWGSMAAAGAAGPMVMSIVAQPAYAQVTRPCDGTVPCSSSSDCDPPNCLCCGDKNAPRRACCQINSNCVPSTGTCMPIGLQMTRTPTSTSTATRSSTATTTPTQEPTQAPTQQAQQTQAPTQQPTQQPTQRPTQAPTQAPTQQTQPTQQPTQAPTQAPTQQTQAPTQAPTQQTQPSLPTAPSGPGGSPGRPGTPPTQAPPTTSPALPTRGTSPGAPGGTGSTPVVPGRSTAPTPPPGPGTGAPVNPARPISPLRTPTPPSINPGGSGRR
jgi:hypothetical protein